jgi:alkanesulfonate monooxygenase SsuD/methylene tetrahydromethanopterin reductase-like flavin-dependent oxidoreductase (luciferase family)
MRFGFWPAAAQPWSEILDSCGHAERTGWDSVWIADHFMPFDDKSGPTHECWALLAGLAAAVPRVRLGSLVAGNTYRHPAVLAKQATSVDHIAGGRLVLGLGAGWQEDEHTAYGIEFSTVKGRLDRLDEACEVVSSQLR